MKKCIPAVLALLAFVVGAWAVLSEGDGKGDIEPLLSEAGGPDALEENSPHQREQPSSDAAVGHAPLAAQPDAVGGASTDILPIEAQTEVLREKYHRLIQVLGETQESNFAEVMDRGLAAESPEVRCLALEIHYYTLKEDDALEYALLDAEEEESDPVRLVSARFLAERGGSDLEKVLVEKSRSGDLESQWAFCVALHLRGRPTALADWALSASHEQDVDVRMKLLQKGVTYPAAVAEPLVERAARGESGRERALAARIFRKLGTPNANDWLVALGRDPDPEVRKAASGGE